MLDIAEYNALVLRINLPLIQPGSKVSHTAGDCFYSTRVGNIPWTRVCTFQDNEIFGGYKTSAYTEMRTPIRDHHYSDWRVFVTGWCE